VSIVYDGDGNRVSETSGGTTTKYLVDDHNPTGLTQIFDELVSTAVIRTYAHGLNRISENQLVGSAWTPSFYGYDGHDNVRFLTNSAGTVTDTYQHDAFGMPIKNTGATANNYLYSGERLDSSIGLYDLRARYYNQATGRFWARDPVEGFQCTPLTYNPYIYVHDDPVNMSDPNGEEAIVEYLLLHFWPQFQIVVPSICPSGTRLKKVIPEQLASAPAPAPRTGLGAADAIEVLPASRNWDGFRLIFERVTPGPTDCPFKIPCPSSPDSFNVGAGALLQDSQQLDAQHNVFYDEHTVTAPYSLLHNKAVNPNGVRTCKATCYQTYTCLGHEIGHYTISYTFSRGQHVTNVNASIQ
jgi:RHS repeat-associated protein